MAFFENELPWICFVFLLPMAIINIINESRNSKKELEECKFEINK